MSKLTSKQLAEMSVEDLMSLSADEIQEVVSILFPVGLYAGLVLSFDVPNPAEDQNFFEVTFRPTAVIELADESELAAANALIEQGAQIKQRFYTTGGFGVQLMRTKFGPLMDETVGAGQPMGAFFAQFTDPAFTLQVAAMVVQRVTTPNKKKGETAEGFQPRTYNELDSVQLAG